MAGFRPADAAALARDHYAVLGVYEPADCTPEEALARIQAAACVGLDELKTLYHQAALQWHPDKLVSHTGGSIASTEVFQQLQNAWHCLQNPKTRHEYDNWLLADAALKCQQAKTQRSLQMHKPAVPAEQMPAVPPEQAAKGGDNQVRISIRAQLLKVASSSAFSVAQKDCQEDLSILQSAELGIVKKLPSDGRCLFHMLKAQIEDATHKGDAQDVDVPTSAVLEAQIAEATHKGDAQEVDVPSSAVLQAYSKVQSSA